MLISTAFMLIFTVFRFFKNENNLACIFCVLFCVFFPTRNLNLQEQKEFSTETEESLKIYAPSLNQSLGKEAEEGDPLQIGKEGLDNKPKTEMAEESLIIISRECNKFSNLDVRLLS